MSVSIFRAPSVALDRVPAILPGLILTSALAAAALLVRSLPGVGVISPLLIAMLFGVLVRNAVGTSEAVKPGIVLSLRKILRFAIVLLGLQLTTQQIAEIGLPGVAIIVATVAVTFIATRLFGVVLRIDPKLATLIAAGTSICGASAVIAANTVTEAADEDVAYAIGCVTIFGCLAMVLYPLTPGLLHLSQHAYGLWAGASIHEIAQVVAAAFQGGKAAGDFGTIAKLTRITMLAPAILFLGFTTVSRPRHVKTVPIPAFVFGFIALTIVNSVVAIPAAVHQSLAVMTSFLLSLALAAMGLETDLRKLKAKGLRPLLLGAMAWVFIAGFSLALIKLTGWTQ